jgi:hypothetical protein
MKWEVVAVGPIGAGLEGFAFRLLYSFPTREEAEAHAECFRIVGTKVIRSEDAKTDSGCSKSTGQIFRVNETL